MTFAHVYIKIQKNEEINLGSCQATHHCRWHCPPTMSDRHFHLIMLTDNDAPCGASPTRHWHCRPTSAESMAGLDVSCRSSLQ